MATKKDRKKPLKDKTAKKMKRSKRPRHAADFIAKVMKTYKREGFAETIRTFPKLVPSTLTYWIKTGK